MISNLSNIDYEALLDGSSIAKNRFQQIISQLIVLSDILEGSGVPTQKADKHQQYFDTTTNKYYRNVDGGTTWVALN